MAKVINTIRAITMFTLLIFILIFCFQNREEVDIAFLQMQVQKLPLFIALFGTLITGLLIGFLAGIISGSKEKREAARKHEESRESRHRPAKTITDEETKTPE